MYVCVCACACLSACVHVCVSVWLPGLRYFLGAIALSSISVLLSRQLQGSFVSPWRKGGNRDLLRWEGMTPTSLPPYPPERTPCQESFPRPLLFIKEIRLAPGSICSFPHQILGNNPCCCTYSVVSHPNVLRARVCLV